MNIQHNWKQKNPVKQPAPKYIPIDQHEAMLKSATANAFAFTVTLMAELGMLALDRGFGFKVGRNEKYRSLLEEELMAFVDGVEWEFDAETLGMRCKEKNQAKPELFYTLEKHDERLKPLIPPEKWKPYTVRFAGFGGRGKWCK